MYAVATLAILVAMALALARAVLGPTLYDRILAINAFGTKTVLIIAVYGFLTGRPDFGDIALVYALINFIGTVAVLKFHQFGDLACPPARARRRAEVAWLLDLVSGLLLLAGAFFVVVGSLGLVRMPGFFTRIHAASITDTLGAGLILAGLLLQSPDVFGGFKLILIFVFMVITGPAATHALAKAALQGGLRPEDTDGSRDLSKIGPPSSNS